MLVSFLEAIGIGDVLDVTLVALLIYAILIWFERAKAAFVVGGMLVTGAVYLLARVTGMEMTTTLFHAFFAILAVAMVVIFQEELRRVFERIAVWSLTRGRLRRTPTPPAVDLITRVAFDLAREKTGALIVLRGRDPLDRHLLGGWPLQGALSEPLLRSIFDRHSIGHDGAVIIEERQVTHFGCRLPLSRDVEQTSRLGTRHAAALGLAELSDALCIVISEERGVVSVARHGKLELLSDPAELEERLAEFAADMQPRAPGQALRTLRTRNARQKLLAFVSALVLWLVFVFSAKHAEHDFEIPVRIAHTSPLLTVAHLNPDTVQVTIDAQIRDFLGEDSDELVASLDLTGATAGSWRFELAGHNIAHPASFTLLRIEPAVVEVELVAKDNAASSHLTPGSEATPEEP